MLPAVAIGRVHAEGTDEIAGAFAYPAVVHAIHCSEVAEMARVDLTVVVYCIVALKLLASALAVLFHSR